MNATDIKKMNRLFSKVRACTASAQEEAEAMAMQEAFRAEAPVAVPRTRLYELPVFGACLGADSLDVEF